MNHPNWMTPGAVRYYKPGAKFAQIKEHVAVASRGDEGLLATVGDSAENGDQPPVERLSQGVLYANAGALLNLAKRVAAGQECTRLAQTILEGMLDSLDRLNWGSVSNAQLREAVSSQLGLSGRRLG